MEMGLTQAAATALNVSDSVTQRFWDEFQSESSVSRKLVSGQLRVTTSSEYRFQQFRPEEGDQLRCLSPIQIISSQHGLE
ncbi:hypothetical protein AVEN_158367-1 [Araneus ventricosus]|uniref:Uncharacterized protein n=1 Tax=Araneus ventricosus TaxID=182803 RepID=A0A4Y2RPS8_ARAVE|nr:hypothetical protein AVEN_158367-1 [Araneus ventricosus]